MSHGQIGARSGDQRSRTILAFSVRALPVFVRGNEHLYGDGLARRVGVGLR